MTGPAAKPRPRRLAAVLAGLVVGVLLIVVLGTALARKAGRAADETWRAEGLDLDAATAALVAQDESPGAARVRELAAPLGIEIPPAGTWRGGTSVVTPVEKEAKDLLAACVAARAPLTPADGALAAWLAAHRAERDALVAQCVGGEPIAWMSRPRDGFAAPLPPARQLVRLADLLAAGAVIDASHGRREEAARALQAAWTIHESLASHPSALAAEQDLRLLPRLLAALRQVAWDDAAAWSGRLGAQHPRDGVLRGLVADAAALRLSARDTAMLTGARWDWLPASVRRAIVPLGPAVARAVVEDIVARLGRLHGILSRTSPCDAGAVSLELPAFGAIPERWDMAADELAAHGAAWRTAVRAEADLYFTAEVLRHRAALRGGPLGEAASPVPACPAWRVIGETAKATASDESLRFDGALPDVAEGAGKSDARPWEFVVAP